MLTDHPSTMKQHYRKPALQGFFQRINLDMLAMQTFPMPGESVLWGKMEATDLSMYS